ncbi:hypothetical protein TKK_0008387 [Trichogramma kaykai]
MSDKKPNASWMFSRKAKAACEERERRQRREYRLRSDDYTWEEVPVEESDAEEIFDEDEDSRAARPNAAPVAATPPTTTCFDWMFSSVAKNARKKREEEALRGKTEVELVDDDDSEESDNADVQAAILQSIQKEPVEATHVRVQQPEQDVCILFWLFLNEAQNVPTNTPVNDEDSVAEATIGEEELTPEILDYIIEEDESFQRVIMESLQQHLVDGPTAAEQPDRLPAIAETKPVEPEEFFERSNEGSAQSVHENKASAEPEPLETSIDKEQRPDGDDIEKDNGDAEKNAPKNEDSSKPESKDVQLEATDVKKACTTKSIDQCIDDLLNGQIKARKPDEGDDSSGIDENDMCESSDQGSLYESDTDGEANQTDENDDKRSEKEEKHVE